MSPHEKEPGQEGFGPPGGELTDEELDPVQGAGYLSAPPNLEPRQRGNIIPPHDKPLGEGIVEPV